MLPESRDRLKFSVSSEAEAKQRFAVELGVRSLDDEEMRFVLDLLVAITEPSETVKLLQQSKRDPERGRLPYSSVHIDIKRSTLMAVAAILDAVFTRGLSLAALTALGYATQTIVFLNRENGEFCNLLSVESALKRSGNVSPREVAASTVGRECVHPQFPCAHRRDGICFIAEPEVIANVSNLVRQNVLSMHSGQISRSK